MTRQEVQDDFWQMLGSINRMQKQINQLLFEEEDRDLLFKISGSLNNLKKAVEKEKLKHLQKIEL